MEKVGMVTPGIMIRMKTEDDEDGYCGDIVDLLGE